MITQRADQSQAFPQLRCSYESTQAETEKNFIRPPSSAKWPYRNPILMCGRSIAGPATGRRLAPAPSPAITIYSPGPWSVASSPRRRWSGSRRTEPSFSPLTFFGFAIEGRAASTARAGGGLRRRVRQHYPRAPTASLAQGAEQASRGGAQAATWTCAPSRQCRTHAAGEGGPSRTPRGPCS